MFGLWFTPARCDNGQGCFGVFDHNSEDTNMYDIYGRKVLNLKTTFQKITILNKQKIIKP